MLMVADVTVLIYSPLSLDLPKITIFFVRNKPCVLKFVNESEANIQTMKGMFLGSRAGNGATRGFANEPPITKTSIG